LANVHSRIVSREQDVRAVLSKISLGEADAGIVYATDLEAAHGQIRAIAIPPDLNVKAEYPVVRIPKSGNSEVAKSFVHFLFDAEAQNVLLKHRFGSPLSGDTVIRLVVPSNRYDLTSKRIQTLPHRTFRATAHGVNRLLSGFDLSSLLAKFAGHQKSIEINAADGYFQSIKLDEVLSDGILLVPTLRGNFQIVFPHLAPKFWVQWVRKITVR
jgi:molybdate transport system substrate-binding protein